MLTNAIDYYILDYLSDLLIIIKNMLVDIITCIFIFIYIVSWNLLFVYKINSLMLSVSLNSIVEATVVQEKVFTFLVTNHLSYVKYLA